MIAAVIDHLPPKGKQTVRYYDLYSNKTRGQQPLIPDRIIPASKKQRSEINNPQSETLLIPAPRNSPPAPCVPSGGSRLVQPFPESIHPDPDWFDQTPTWKVPEIRLDDGRILVLEYT